MTEVMWIHSYKYHIYLKNSKVLHKKSIYLSTFSFKDLQNISMFSDSTKNIYNT